MAVDPDDDKTVFIRPSRGRDPARAAPPTQAAPIPPAVPIPSPVPVPPTATVPPAVPIPTAAPVTPDPSASPASNVSPLIAAASPLLQLLARLRTLRRPPNPQALRDRVMHDLAAFARQGQEMNIATDLLRPAHFALCASVDDVVLNTPWGVASGWANPTLVTAFKYDPRGADKVIDDLREMQGEPDRFLPVIELIYLCLSLGVMGRYREARGGRELEQIRNEAYAVIAARRPAADAELSRRWQGVAVPYQPGRRSVPVWVALACAAALCGALVFWTSFSLNAASDGLQAHALGIPPVHMPQLVRLAVVAPVPPPPAPPAPSVLSRLQASLGPEIDSQAISVIGTPTMPIVRINDRALFALDSATIRASSLPLLARVATALRDESGSLQVIDYTDNRPVRTVQFPSSFQLSKARANGIRAVLARSFGDPARVSAEGRADADPIAPNTTVEGREQNQRVEIVLHPQS